MKRQIQKLAWAGIVAATLPAFNVNAADNLHCNDNCDWYDTVTAAEHHDSKRSRLYEDVIPPDFLFSEEGARVDYQTSSSDYLYPYNLVTRGEQELFVYGGIAVIPKLNCLNSFDQPKDRDCPDHTYVAKLDATTLEELWRTPLISYEDEFYNYPGSIGIHSNGYAYVIYGHRLSKIDPNTGVILQTAELPTFPGTDPEETAYNGFLVLKDGTIAVKSAFNRPPDCPVDSFMVPFLCTSDPDKIYPAAIGLIDPDTMEILDAVYADFDEYVYFGRFVVAEIDGDEYIILTGTREIIRYKIQNNQLINDESWVFPYGDLMDETETASAGGSLMGDWFIFATNGLGSKTPLSLFAVNINDASLYHATTPFPEGSSNLSMISNMPSVDEVNMNAYVADVGFERVGAFHLDPVRGFSMLWTHDQLTATAPSLIGTADQRVFISMDTYDGDSDLHEVIWRDAITGEELTRSPLLGKTASHLPPGFGDNSPIYFLSVVDEKIHKLFLSPKNVKTRRK